MEQSLQPSSLVALNDASKTAIEVVNRYKSIDPPRDEDETNIDTNKNNPWRNVEAIGSEIKTARSGLGDAWRKAKTVHETEEESDQEDDDDDENENENENKNDNENENSHDASRASNSIDTTRTIDLDMEANIDVLGVNANVNANVNTNVNANDSGDSSGDGDKNDNGEEKDDNDDSSDNNIMPDEDFRAQYMNMMTETFGDALEQIHQQGGESVDFDVDVLVECLQSGIDFLEPHERKNQKSFFDSLVGSYDGKAINDAKAMNDGDNDIAMDGNDGDGDVDDDGGVTVHELRQRRLGYLVSTNGSDNE
jgi:hypothetical protein